MYNISEYKANQGAAIQGFKFVLFPFKHAKLDQNNIQLKSSICLKSHPFLEDRTPSVILNTDYKKGSLTI